MTEPGSNQPNRAIIRAGESLPALRGPGELITRKVAVSVVAGAVGTFALKKLIELVTEDLYGRAKRLLRRAPNPPTVKPAPEIVEPAAAPASRVLFMRVTRITRMVGPGHGETLTAIDAAQQHLEQVEND